jgi:aspartoacylase
MSASAAASAKKKFRCLIVGGTHGNERAGVQLLKLFPSTYSTIIEVNTLIGNPLAVQRSRRYVDEDLNRCFAAARLEALPAGTYESFRAREVAAMFGPKHRSDVDMCFDLHNSTSNTGVLLCMHRSDALAHEVAGYLVSIDSKVRVAHWTGSGDVPYLPSLTKSGMTVEVGPVMHGTVHYPSLARVRELLRDAIWYLERRAQAPLDAPRAMVDLQVGERHGEVDFPRDAGGDLSAFVHPSLQGLAEMQPGSHLVQGQPLFVDAAGNVVQRYQPSPAAGQAPGSPPLLLFPLFVNEQAYNEKGVAFYLNSQQVVQVAILSHVAPRPAVAAAQL